MVSNQSCTSHTHLNVIQSAGAWLDRVALWSFQQLFSFQLHPFTIPFSATISERFVMVKQVVFTFSLGSISLDLGVSLLMFFMPSNLFAAYLHSLVPVGSYFTALLVSQETPQFSETWLPLGNVHPHNT